MKRKIYFSISLALFFAFSAISSMADTVQGVIYHDQDLSSESHYLQSIDEWDIGLPDIEVSLIGAEDEIVTETEADGSFTFGDIQPGTYLLDVTMDGYESTSNNHARRVPEAIREGNLDIVCFGDSIGVVGSEYNYPYRLTWFFEELTEVTLHNVHRGGSRSWEWLPGDPKAYWEERLMPVLPDADLVTFTITGNDMDIYVEGQEAPYDMAEIIRGVIANPEYILDAVPRLGQIIENVQEVNPDADLVFILYPNFANSTIIESYTGPLLQPVAALLMKTVIGWERSAAGEKENIVLADTFSYYGDTWMDEFLVDEVHPSDPGSQDYADQVFQALGGVIVGGEDPFGLDRMMSFYAPDIAPYDDDDDDDFSDDDDDNNPGDDDTAGDDDTSTGDDDQADDDDDDDDDGCCG